MKSVLAVAMYLFLTSTQAQNLPYAFAIVPADFVEKPGTKIVIENMPRIRSQAAFSICYGFAAATLAQKYYCDEKAEIIPNCSNLPPEREISPIHRLI